MKKLLIVDAQNQFMRSYIVNPTLSPNGDPLGGVVGFLQTMNKLCRQVRPDAFVVVWDGDGGSSKRRSMSPSEGPFRLDLGLTATAFASSSPIPI